MIKTIREIKLGKSGTTNNQQWTAYTVIFADGSKASTFDNSIANKGGCEIDCELEQTEKEGKTYTNIKSWVLAPPVGVKVPPPSNEGHSTQLEQLSDSAKGYCFSYAKDMAEALINRSQNPITAKEAGETWKYIKDLMLSEWLIK
jgi:hypothetical protein